MAHSLIAASGTGVVFVAMIPMRLAVTAGERGPSGPYPSCRIHWSRHQCPPPFALAAASTNFLLVAVSVATVVVRARLAAVSCWRMVVLFVAARARLLSAILSCPVVGVSQEAHRAPNQEALPPAEANIWHWRLRWARQNAVFHTPHMRELEGRPSQLLTLRGKC
jgi:hypothetical protein